MNHVEIIERAWNAQLTSDRSERSAQPRDYVYASGRRVCVRQMAYELMHPDETGDFDAATLDRMNAGSEYAEAVAISMARCGRRASDPFRVIEQERRVKIVDQGKLIIVGKIDLRFQFLSDRHRRPIMELKGGQATEGVRTLEDYDRNEWSSHMLDQLLVYLYAENEPVGWMGNRVPGRLFPNIVEVVLEDHLDRAQSFIDDAHAAVDARFGGEMPPHTTDLRQCQRCPFYKKRCKPPTVDFGQGVVQLTDPRAEAVAAERAKLERDGKRYKQLDGKLRDFCRAVYGDHQGEVLLLIGNTEIACSRRRDGAAKLTIERTR